MALQLGIDGAYFRLGTQPATVFLGDAVVQTVPGAPVITSAVAGLSDVEVFWDAPNDGGSAILEYRLYVEGVLDAGAQIDEFGATTTEAQEDAEVRVSAVNAVGEGPKSAPVEVTG